MKLGIVLISHGGFARGAKESIEMIAGTQEHLVALALTEDKTVEQLTSELDDVYQTLKKDCDHILALCDIYGGTPFNVLLREMMQGKEIIAYTGLSLPLLIDILFSREGMRNTNELIDHIKEIQPMIIRQIEVPNLEDNEEED